MAKHEDKETKTVKPVWKITYQYVGANYALRTGAYVIAAETEEEARQKANGLGAHLGFFKLTGVRPY